MAMSGTINGTVANKHVLVWDALIGDWVDIGDVYKFEPTWTATKNEIARTVTLKVNMRWRRTNPQANFDTVASRAYNLRVDGTTRSSGSKRFQASWASNIYDAGSMSYTMPYEVDGTKSALVRVYANPYTEDGTAPGESIAEQLLTFDPIGAQGAVYYGTGGQWKKCLVYYGTGGQWKQVIPYYGSGGTWKQLG